jgi:hypothetical protein
LRERVRVWVKPVRKIDLPLLIEQFDPPSNSLQRRENLVTSTSPIPVLK